MDNNNRHCYVTEMLTLNTRQNIQTLDSFTVWKCNQIDLKWRRQAICICHGNHFIKINECDKNAIIIQIQWEQIEAGKQEADIVY